jgi:hypothetical protein
VIYGISQIVLGVQLRQTGHTADKVLEQAV